MKISQTRMKRGDPYVGTGTLICTPNGIVRIGTYEVDRPKYRLEMAIGGTFFTAAIPPKNLEKSATKFASQCAKIAKGGGE